MQQRIWFALATALLVWIWPAHGRAEPQPHDSMIIVDGSNSMWARVEGRSKIEHAYEAISKATRAAPNDARIGLMAFGYRSPRNCQDINVLVKPAAGTASRIAKSVQRVKPRGRAPITGALQRASRELRSTKRKRKIVLLTDGRDNCRGDPCALARRLGKSRDALSVDVIAFAFADRSTKDVACIAKETGGRFEEVNTPADLEAALRTSLAPEPPPEPQVTAEADQVPPESKPNSEDMGKTDDVAQESDERAATSEPEPGTDIGPSVADSADPPAVDELSVGAIPPGAIPIPPRVAATQQRVEEQHADRQPAEQQPTELQRAEEQPTETKVAAISESTVPIPPRLDLVRPTGPAEAAAPAKRLPPLGPATAALLKPGKPQIRPLLADRASTLDKAALVRRSVAPRITPAPGSEATLTLRATLTDDGAPLNAGLRWLVHRHTANGKRATQLAAKSGSAQPKLNLESGTYTVVARLDLVEVESTLTIDAQAPVEATVVLNAGILRVHGAPVDQASGEAVYSVLTAERGKRERVLDQASGPVGVFFIPAGTYRVFGRLGLARDLESITLKAGTVVDVSLALDKGFVKLATVGKKKNRPLGGMTYSVYELASGDEDEPREIARSRADRPLLKLPAGRYRVVVRNGRHHTAHEVSVRAGELTSQVVSLNAGTLKLASRLTGRGDDLTSGFTYRILSGGRDREGRRREIARLSTASDSIDLPAGSYRVESLYGDVNALASADVQIKAGSLTDVTLEHRAGLVKPVLVRAPGGAALPSVSWTLMDGNGKELKRSTETAPRFKLAAGDYRLLAVREGQSQLVEFSVATGDELTIEVLSEDSPG